MKNKLRTLLAVWLAVWLTILQTSPLPAQNPGPNITKTGITKTGITRPNIVYIYMDDLGYEETAPYGNRLMKTPNLTRMAAQGIKFTQHYSGTAVCAPSRCALMTGLHTGHCQVRGNRQMEPGGQMPLSDQTVTVARLLQTAGYTTALSGKWGLGGQGTSGEPNRQGFDQYYGYLDQVLAHNAFPGYLIRNGKREYLKNKVVWEENQNSWSGGLGSYASEQLEYANDLFTEEALAFIGQKRQQPFFLYLAYTIPHDNGEARTKEERFESPTLKPFEKENWTLTEKKYAASVSRMDDYIGRILKRVKDAGLEKNTIVFFSSDNGSSETIPGRFVAGNRLRGLKRSPYEGGIRAPLLAVWPGKIKPGTVTELPSAQWDFLPTACELARVALPDSIDGISFLSTLLGRPQERTHSHLYWEFHEKGGWQALRRGDYKLVHQVTTGAYELYDLSSDMAEKNNLIDREPALAAQLKQLMQATRTESSYFNFK
jgi:arylsulfatase A-like enzyme